MSEVQISTGYQPRSHQAYLHKSLKRFNVLVMHRRFGKTVFGINEMIDQCLRFNKPDPLTGAPLKNPRYAYIAPLYKQAKSVMWDYAKQFTENLPGVKKNENDLIIDLPAINNGRLMLLGGDNPDSLKGIYLDGVILDEYATMNPVVWREVIRPTLSDRHGWAIFMGTPKGKNHFHTVYDGAVNGFIQEDGTRVKRDDWFGAMFKASETGILSQEELDSARDTMTEEEYEQEYECFPPGTLIQTRRGNVPIEDVRVGDSVLTHRCRWRPVTDVMSKKYQGRMIAITAFGTSKPLLVTPKHPLLVYDKATASRSWKQAQHLEPGDCLVLPKAKPGPKMLSDDWARLIAWFVTEGSVSGNIVSFSLNPHNQAELDHVAGILTRLGYDPQWIGGNMSVYNVALADLLTGVCGSGAGNKRLPFDLISGHESVVFDELIEGDGCVVETMKGGRRFMFTTISRALAHDMRTLAAMLGRRSGITVRPPGKSIIEGRTVLCRESYSVGISNGIKVNHSRARQVFPTKLGIAHRVQAVEIRDYTGTIHNLSVKQDESYVAEGRAVHNCSFQSGLVGAYFTKELAQAEKDGRITEVPYDPMLPVESYWDLGMNDVTAVWFVQQHRSQYRVIRYMEAPDLSIPEWDAKIKRETGYNLYSVNLPHDAEVRDLGTGKTRADNFRQLGYRVNVIPRTNDKVGDSINAARNVFPRCVFDAKNCDRGLKALAEYQRKWDSKSLQFSPKPLHNWASNGSDGFQTFAMGVRDEAPDRYEQRQEYADNEYDVLSF